MRRLAAPTLALCLLAASPTATAQVAPAPAPQVDPSPSSEGHEEVYEGWWFWAAISAVVLGVVTAVIVDVTTDDPAPSDPVAPAPMGLRLRF
jgi:hypothetical protein